MFWALGFVNTGGISEAVIWFLDPYSPQIRLAKYQFAIQNSIYI